MSASARSPAIRVIELPNIGPVQFAGMLLADMGAEVLRLDRATDVATGSSVAGFVSPYSVIDRGRRSVGIDLKHERGAEVVLRLCEQADVLLEGFRPGVAERLGVGPDACRARNPKLVYARMTGWGQDGPLAGDVGHDVNYLSIAGVLWHIGPEGGAPVPPINLLADFGGGGSLVVMGILAALVERATSGEGQVVDAAMVDGSAQLMSIFFGLDAMGGWGPRGTNILDGGAHFYNVYETSDGEYVSIASYEPKFYANLLALIGPLGFDDVDPRRPDGPLAVAGAPRSRIGGADPHAHECASGSSSSPVTKCASRRCSRCRRRARTRTTSSASTFVDVDGAPQPAPAPRFSRTPSAVQGAPVAAGADTDTALVDWGFSAAEVAALKAEGAIA